MNSEEVFKARERLYSEVDRVHRLVTHLVDSLEYLDDEAEYLNRKFMIDCINITTAAIVYAVEKGPRK